MNESLVKGISRRKLPIDDLVENPHNVNEMDEATFNQLCEGLEESGYVPALDVAPLPDGKYLIVDGNHRKRAAVLLGHTELECTILEGLTDQELQEILSARIAVVRGKVNKTRFTQLWLQVRQRYDQSYAMHVLGVTSEKQLHTLINVPKRQVEAKVAAREAAQIMINRAKVVENLATVIRAAHGDGGIGEFDYMVFQVQGSQLMLVRCSKEELEQLQIMAEIIASRKVGVTDCVLRGLRVILAPENHSQET